MQALSLLAIFSDNLAIFKALFPVPSLNALKFISRQGVLILIY
jgi:hypothetical protein